MTFRLPKDYFKKLVAVRSETSRAPITPGKWELKDGVWKLIITPSLGRPAPTEALEPDSVWKAKQTAMEQLEALNKLGLFKLDILIAQVDAAVPTGETKPPTGGHKPLDFQCNLVDKPGGYDTDRLNALMWQACCMVARPTTTGNDDIDWLPRSSDMANLAGEEWFKVVDKDVRSKLVDGTKSPKEFKWAPREKITPLDCKPAMEALIALATTVNRVKTWNPDAVRTQHEITVPLDVPHGTLSELVEKAVTDAMQSIGDRLAAESAVDSQYGWFLNTSNRLQVAAPYEGEQPINTGQEEAKLYYKGLVDLLAGRGGLSTEATDGGFKIIGTPNRTISGLPADSAHLVTGILDRADTEFADRKLNATPSDDGETFTLEIGPKGAEIEIPYKDLHDDFAKTGLKVAYDSGGSAKLVDDQLQVSVHAGPDFRIPASYGSHANELDTERVRTLVNAGFVGQIVKAGDGHGLRLTAPLGWEGPYQHIVISNERIEGYQNLAFRKAIKDGGYTAQLVKAPNWDDSPGDFLDLSKTTGDGKDAKVVTYRLPADRLGAFVCEMWDKVRFGSKFCVTETEVHVFPSGSKQASIVLPLEHLTEHGSFKNRSDANNLESLADDKAEGRPAAITLLASEVLDQMPAPAEEAEGDEAKAEGDEAKAEGDEVKAEAESGEANPQ